MDAKKEYFKAVLWDNFKDSDRNMKIRRQLDPEEVASLLQ